MAAHPPKTRLILSLLACCCSVAAAFLLQDGNHDETLPGAYEAIQQLNLKLTEVMAENERLKQRLQTAETAQKTHAQMIQSLGSKVSRDFIWYDNDWILAFRGTSGIGKPVYEAWTNVGHHDDDPMTRDTLPCGCSTVNGSLPCDQHYRSRLLDTWPSASIDQVRLVLYENGVEKEHVTFTGTGSDYMSWFSQSRIVESSWTDLKAATGLNFFSIAGDGGVVLRRFFISHLYHGCPDDVGWLVAMDQTTDTCEWATVQHVPAFLYSPSNHELQWQGHGFREADVMAVFVKLRQATELNEVCLS